MQSSSDSDGRHPWKLPAKKSRAPFSPKFGGMQHLLPNSCSAMCAGCSQDLFLLLCLLWPPVPCCQHYCHKMSQHSWRPAWCSSDPFSVACYASCRTSFSNFITRGQRSRLLQLAAGCPQPARHMCVSQQLLATVKIQWKTIVASPA